MIDEGACQTCPAGVSRLHHYDAIGHAARNRVLGVAIEPQMA
jgi:hypothetical protein